MSTMNGMFKDMFAQIESGCCRLGVNGNIAVKTSSGYKTFDVKKTRLTNVTNFCFDIGQEMFFVVPTTKAQIGDILLVDGHPKCVIENNDNKTIKVMDYENSAIQEIVPERHVFMGQTYFYRKIVSMFGSANFLKGGKGINGLLKTMLKMNILTKFMGGGNTGNDFGGNNAFAMLAMSSMFGGDNGKNGLFGDMSFDNMFDIDFDEITEEDSDDEETEEELEAKLAALKAKKAKKAK